MQWLNWGKQSNIFGFSIGLILIIEAAVNLSDLLRLHRFEEKYGMPMIYHDLGTIWSESMSDPKRIHLLGQSLICIIWGFLTLLNVAVLRKAAWLARITFFLACTFYVTLTCGLLYGIRLYFQDAYLEGRPLPPTTDPFLLSSRLLSPFPWPAHFWVTLLIKLVVCFFISVLVLDMHLSYMYILKAGGTGWENKSHIQIQAAKDEGESILANLV